MVDWSGAAAGPSIATGPTGGFGLEGAMFDGDNPYGNWDNQGNLTIDIAGGNNPVAPGTMDMEGSLAGGANGGIMGPMTGPGLEMEGALVGGAYNANNMGGVMPGGAPGGPGQNPGAGQMPGGMVNGAMSEGGGEPLIRRLQGLTPQQQNFLLSNPDALRAFNQEYIRILQSGQAGSVGVGQETDAGNQYGQYNLTAANTGGLISQGTNNGGGM